LFGLDCCPAHAGEKVGERIREKPSSVLYRDLASLLLRGLPAVEMTGSS